jgi:hypothetical protein
MPLYARTPKTGAGGSTQFTDATDPRQFAELDTDFNDLATTINALDDSNIVDGANIDFAKIDITTFTIPDNFIQEVMLDDDSVSTRTIIDGATNIQFNEETNPLGATIVGSVVIVTNTITALRTNRRVTISAPYIVVVSSSDVATVITINIYFDAVLVRTVARSYAPGPTPSTLRSNGYFSFYGIDSSAPGAHTYELRMVAAGPPEGVVSVAATSCFILVEEIA